MALCKLYPPQLASIQPALKDQTRRFVLNHEMGVGKSACAVEIINQLYPGSVLVVCPAMVRLDWVKAFDKFDTARRIPQIHRYGVRKNLTKLQTLEQEVAHLAAVQVVSPDLVAHVRQTNWDLLILDEIHMYKNEKAIRSKQVRKLLESNPQAMVLGLTGTLAPNDLGDIHNPLDMLWPGRLGNKYSFRHRYQNRRLKEINDKTGETVTEFYGLNEAHAAELATRLAGMSTRVTRADVAQFLPSFDIKLIRFDVGVDWTLPGYTRSDIDYAVEQAAKAKISCVVDWVAATKESTTHVAVLAHHKNIAWALAEQIATKLPLERVIYVDGEIPVDKRIAKIEEAKAAGSAILVGTIQSMGIGISLTKFTQAIFAEFHWSPGVMEQVLLRFSRLDSMVPSAVYFSMVPGTIDEVIATRLEEKFAAINPIATAGIVGGKLDGLLQLDEEAFLRGITEAAMRLEDDGGYSL